jgi:hypothetical protein
MTSEYLDYVLFVVIANFSKCYQDGTWAQRLGGDKQFFRLNKPGVASEKGYVPQRVAGTLGGPGQIGGGFFQRMKSVT